MTLQIKITRFIGRSLFYSGFVSLIVLGSGMYAQAASQDPLEQATEQKIQRQLDALLGPGKSKVSVSGQQKLGLQERSKVYTRPQILSQSERKTEQPNHTSQSSETHWVYDQHEILKTEAPSVEQRSVSVVYEPPFSPEGEEVLDEATVAEMVWAAAGLTEKTGDLLQVKALRFAPTRLLEPLKEAKIASWVLFTLIAVLGILLGLTMGGFVAWRRKRKNIQPYEAFVYVPQASLETPLLTTSALNSPD